MYCTLIILSLSLDNDQSRVYFWRVCDFLLAFCYAIGLVVLSVYGTMVVKFFYQTSSQQQKNEHTHLTQQEESSRNVQQIVQRKVGFVHAVLLFPI